MKQMFWRGILLLLSVTGPSPVVAEGANSTSLSYLEAGIICPPLSVATVPAPDTVAGVTHVIAQEPPFVSNSRKVPAALGIGFGVKAQSAQADGIENVTITVAHPPIGPDAVQFQSFTTDISGSAPSLTFYQFDHAYELVPGNWTLTAVADNQVIYAIAFEVVAPGAVPELAGVCGYLDLLS